MKQTVSDLGGSVNFTHKQLEDFKSRMIALEKDNKTLKDRLQKVEVTSKETVKEMQEKFNNVERYSRQYGIRIKGVKRLKDVRDYNKKVAEIITENNLGPFGSVEENLKTIEIAHPIGKEGDQLIARFFSRVHRNSVVQKAKSSMNPKAGSDGIRLVEDMIKQDYDLKRKAFQQTKDAHAGGSRVRFTKGKLWINGQEVQVHDG